MNKYLSRFLALKCAPDVLATVGNLGNKPEKEIMESYNENLGVSKRFNIHRN